MSEGKVVSFHEPAAVADDDAATKVQLRMELAVLKELNRNQYTHAGSSSQRPSSQTAVAGSSSEPAEDDEAPEDETDTDSDTAGQSIAGDTVASASDADGNAEDIANLRQERLAPKTPIEGTPQRGRSSARNKYWEVGNFGLFFGNWGMRGTVLGPGEQNKRRDTQDRQILKCPAMVLVLVEASRKIEDLLRQPPKPGSAVAVGLDRRSTHEHFVQRGEENSVVLVAVRKDVANSLECLFHEVHDDHPYKEKGKPKMARTRTLVCRVGFKQNIGHLGQDIVVAGVHGHYRTTLRIQKSLISNNH